MVKKKLAWALVALLLSAVTLRMLFLRGLVFPIRVSGGSMADAFYGSHLPVVCQDCRITFSCDPASPPRTGLAVCPNCGYSANKLQERFKQRGRRVILDRLGLWMRPPRRWDLVAFRASDGTWSVKRVVGLPEERVRIHQGELYANGQILRKPMDQLRRMAILVHDDRYRPTRDMSLPPRWHSERVPGRWRAEPNGYAFTGPSTDQGPSAEAPTDWSAYDWLVYHQWRCYAGPADRTDEVSIRDNYGYNQGVSRELRGVTDVFLCGTFQIEGEGRAAFQIHDGRENFTLTVDVGNRKAQVYRKSDLLASCELTGVVAGRSFEVEVGLLDHQVVATVEGRVALRAPYRPASSPAQPISCPVRIGADGGAMRAWNLRILRDIYYLDPAGLGHEWRTIERLDSDQYLVLGDNPPVSVDSRHWADPGLSRRRLLGTVWQPFPYR